MGNEGGYWAHVEKVWDAISIYEDPDVFARQFEESPVAARTLFAAHWCQSEICNGGFHQFFFNSTGVLAPEAVEAFRAIDLPAVAHLVERAMAKLGSPYPRMRSMRQKQLRLLAAKGVKPSEIFSELDDEFFRLWGDGSAWKQAANRYADA